MGLVPTGAPPTCRFSERTGAVQGSLQGRAFAQDQDSTGPVPHEAQATPRCGPPTVKCYNAFGGARRRGPYMIHRVSSPGKGSLSRNRMAPTGNRLLRNCTRSEIISGQSVGPVSTTRTGLLGIVQPGDVTRGNVASRKGRPTGARFLGGKFGPGPKRRLTGLVRLKVVDGGDHRHARRFTLAPEAW